MRQVHADRGAAAGDGRAGGPEEAAGAGGERGPGAAAHLPRLRNRRRDGESPGLTVGPRGANSRQQQRQHPHNSML